MATMFLHFKATLGPCQRLVGPAGEVVVEFAEMSSQVIGEDRGLTTPFGVKPLVYADYTASGRAYAPIEDFIRRQVLPYYANTHSESSYTGRQTGLLREQAREIIRSAVNAGEEHAVIFCGTGATAAVNKLVRLLGLQTGNESGGEPPVVLIGPYEHHSNELPWRESSAQLEVIPLDAAGALDMAALEASLQTYAGRQIYGSFSAASNVTGLKTDTRQVSELVHRYGGRVFWDYAAAAPYVGIDASAMDAVFISPHKFLGGPGTPGILVVRRDLLKNAVPAVPGGGTVSFVGPDFHRYLEDCERREEGGTPGIIEAIRAGLVFKLQQQVGVERIEAREKELVEQVLARWGQNPNIRIIGNPELPRLSIVSLQVCHEGQPLHYAFVVALLNDLFGIQARGGCSCAGPYGHALLGIDATTSRLLDTEMSKGNTVLRPGWVRLNFNYFIEPERLEYLLRAMELVAEHGWKMHSIYEYQPARGRWLHRDDPNSIAVSLADFDPAGAPDLEHQRAPSFDECLDLAEQRLVSAEPASDCSLRLDARAEMLRWFYLPGSQSPAA